MQEGRPAAGSSVAPPAVEAPPPEAEAWPAWPAVEGVASSGSLAPPVPPASDVAEQDPEHFWNAQVDHDAFWNAQSPNFEHWQALHGFTTAAAMASQHADSGKHPAYGEVCSLSKVERERERERTNIFWSN